MLNVKKFTFNPFSENTYVVTDEFKNAVIIDPGCYYKAEQNELDSYVLKNNLISILFGLGLIFSGAQ